MRIKITRNTVADGHPVFAGDVLEATEQAARYLIALGKAVKAAEEKPRAAAPEVAEEVAETKKEAAEAPAKAKKTTRKRGKKND